jgi:hypothetical protein
MTIEERICRLEKQASRWRIIATCQAAFVVLIALAAWWPQSLSVVTQAQAQAVGGIPNEIKTRLLTIVDKNGKPVGSFGAAGETSMVALTVGRLLDKHRVAVIVDSDSSTLSLGGSEGELHLNESTITLYPFDKQYADYKESMRSGKPRDPVKALSDRKKAVVIQCGEGTGGGLIDILNPFNKRVVSVQSNKANEGSVLVHDANGILRNALGTP